MTDTPTDNPTRVTVIETLPAPLDQALKAEAATAPALIAIASDLTLSGDYGQEWLVVTDETIRVYPAVNGTLPAPRLNVQLASIKQPQVESLVGGGALVLSIAGTPTELVRFSNAQQRKFGRVVKYLSDVVSYRDNVAKGKEVKELPKLEEDKDEPKRCSGCNLLLPDGTKVCPACLNKGKVLMRLFGYLKPYWKLTAVVWTLMITGVLLSLVGPSLIGPLTDKVMAPVQPIPFEERMATLSGLILIMIMTGIASQSLQIVRARCVVKLGTSLSHDLRTELYSHLQFLSLRFFEKRPVGSMISRITQDTQALESVLVDGLQHFVINILHLIAIGILLFYMNWKLTLLVLIPMPIVMVLSHVFWKRIMSMWRRFWHTRSRLTATVSDSLSGMRVVKAFAKESVEVSRFREHSENMMMADRAAEQTWTTLFPILWFIASTGTYIVWYFGGTSVLNKEMTFGTLNVFLAFLGMFYGPLQFLSRIADYLARSLTSAERVFEILDSVSEVKDADDSVALPRIEGKVEFKDVTFGYDKNKPVLKDVSYTINQGEMIGLVGQSGAGKSTTINLICRFYEVQSGQILIDGVDIRKIRQQDLRSQIGVVLQDTFLFNGTIAENVAYARPEATLEEIMAAAKAANAHDFIVSKADGYDTKVGERGQSLSGGERQRISIARAILHNPRILILDEATASVDTDTEKQIQEAIARLVKGRTTIAIAHRLSTLRNANRLLVLKDGKIAEMGTHEELLEKKGEFHRLVSMQQEMSKIVQLA